MQIREKKVSDSATTQVQIIMPEHINGANRLFGGRLVEWIDVVAGVVARRHSNCDITTVSIDNLHFKAPAKINDTMVLSGRIVRVGNTSMEVRVDTYVEHLDGFRELVNTAYLTMVALDVLGRPTQVPRLILETEEQKEECKRAEERISRRKNEK